MEQLEMENTNEELADYIAIIKRNSHRIGKLITELLQTSNPGHIILKPHSVNEIVENAYETIHDRVQLKNIKIIKNYSPHNPIIQADSNKLEMAVTNLILNAIEAMKENEGVLTLVTSVITDKCHIVIQDNGCGMTIEQQNRLFEPYFTGKTSGLGLGMTTTLNIVKAHNAQIFFVSELDKGTRFNIIFPI